MYRKLPGAYYRKIHQNNLSCLQWKLNDENDVSLVYISVWYKWIHNGLLASIYVSCYLGFSVLNEVSQMIMCPACVTNNTCRWVQTLHQVVDDYHAASISNVTWIFKKKIHNALKVWNRCCARVKHVFLCYWCAILLMMIPHYASILPRRR